jgi:hypothetical protein
MSRWKYKTGGGGRSLPALDHHVTDISFSAIQQYNEDMPKGFL